MCFSVIASRGRADHHIELTLDTSGDVTLTAGFHCDKLAGLSGVRKVEVLASSWD